MRQVEANDGNSDVDIDMGDAYEGTSTHAKYCHVLPITNSSFTAVAPSITPPPQNNPTKRPCPRSVSHSPGAFRERRAKRARLYKKRLAAIGSPGSHRSSMSYEFSDAASSENSVDISDIEALPVEGFRDFDTIMEEGNVSAVEYPPPSEDEEELHSDIEDLVGLTGQAQLTNNLPAVANSPSPGNTSVPSDTSFNDGFVPDSEEERELRNVRRREVIDLTIDKDGDRYGDSWNPFENDEGYPGTGRFSPEVEPEDYLSKH